MSPTTRPSRLTRTLPKSATLQQRRERRKAKPVRNLLFSKSTEVYEGHSAFTGVSATACLHRASRCMCEHHPGQRQTQANPSRRSCAQTMTCARLRKGSLQKIATQKRRPALPLRSALLGEALRVVRVEKSSMQIYGVAQNVGLGPVIRTMSHDARCILGSLDTSAGSPRLIASNGTACNNVTNFLPLL